MNEKLEAAFKAVQIITATINALEAAVDATRQALADSRGQLQNALTELEKLKEQLAANDAAADSALDAKFRGG